MTKHRALPLCCVLVFAGAATTAASSGGVAGETSSSTVPGLGYTLEQVAEGVYCATAAGVPYVISNSVVILGEDSVLVVDPGAGPAEARALQAAIRKITELPVRYVVDTHFHFDHAYGSEAFSGAVVIGHEFTRGQLGPDALAGRTVAGYVGGLTAQVEKARAEAEAEPDGEKRAEKTRRAAALEAYRQELTELRPVAPVVTFNDSLTVWMGGREVRLLHVGRGHTAGDILVHLPRERVLCSGDHFNGYIGYMGDAFVDEWADSLERLAALDFETVIAGHGAPFKGKDKIAPVQACLRDLWRQAAALKSSGVAAEEAARRVDLRAHAAHFPRFTQVGFEPPALRRIYEVIDERAAQASRP